MKKLVIGGSGFVGSVLAERLINRGHQVVVFDNLKFGFYKNIENLPVEFIQGDIQQPQQLDEILSQVDVVYFLATMNIIAAENDYNDCIKINVIGLNCILDLLKKHKHIKRFVYTSTSSIYGNNSNITEESKTNFLNVYSTTKYAGECLCNLYSNTEGLPVTVIRYTNTYGKNQRPESKFCGVISKFVEKAVLGADIEINGDGSQIRDFMYVEDAADITIELGDLQQTIGQDINLNTNKSYTILEIAKMVKSLTNSDSEIKTVVERKIDNIKRRKLNNNKLLSLLDFKFTDIETGIKKTIDWYKNSYSK